MEDFCKWCTISSLSYLVFERGDERVGCAFPRPAAARANLGRTSSCQDLFSASHIPDERDDRRRRRRLPSFRRISKTSRIRQLPSWLSFRPSLRPSVPSRRVQQRILCPQGASEINE